MSAELFAVSQKLRHKNRIEMYQRTCVEYLKAIVVYLKDREAKRPGE